MRRVCQMRTWLSVPGAALLGLALAAPLASAAEPASREGENVIRLGIIGLDTSHSIAFTKSLNRSPADPKFQNCRVVAAYPYGSQTIESSTSRIPGYIEEIKKLDVEIVDSIETLLAKVDGVLLETNDGHPRLEQTLQVLEAGKPVFIDKPVAASLRDVLMIYDAAERLGVPAFSTSSLRYAGGVQDVRGGSIGTVFGCDAYSPASLEPSHPDLFWYGIHGVEMLFSCMGTGLQSVSRTTSDGMDVVVGKWDGGRIGTFRGIRAGKSGYGGYAFGEKEIAKLGPYQGYDPMLVEIAQFFRSGVAPVPAAETIELYAFMAAADESKRQGGKPVEIAAVLQQARAEIAQAEAKN